MSKKNTRKNRPAKGVFSRLADLYSRMAFAYSKTAQQAGLTCEGCTDNCCYSFFQHHTYVEWAYLWRGMMLLPEDKRQDYLQRAKDVVAQYQACIAQGVQPRAMCPLNDNGLCGLYEHRLMICRMHGTRNTLTLPNGSVKAFQGCFRFRENIRDNAEEDIPTLDRTPLYKELVQLEMEFVGARYHSLPRVDMTLAEMLVAGPPRVK